MYEVYNLKFLKNMECMKHVIPEGYGMPIIPERYEMPEAYNP